jgi:hypothetical protein
MTTEYVFCEVRAESAIGLYNIDNLLCEVRIEAMVGLHSGDRLCFLFGRTKTEETSKAVNITIKYDRMQMSQFTLSERLRVTGCDRL